MSSTQGDELAAGLSAVLKEHGLERARADSNWLKNVLADFSPHTQALNRVAALAAREGVPGWLQSAAPGTVDAVVAQAVSRLVSNHAIDQGKAHDAVIAWAKALGVQYSGQRASSQPAMVWASSQPAMVWARPLFIFLAAAAICFGMVQLRPAMASLADVAFGGLLNLLWVSWDGFYNSLANGFVGFLLFLPWGALVLAWNTVWFFVALPLWLLQLIIGWASLFYVPAVGLAILYFLVRWKATADRRTFSWRKLTFDIIATVLGLIGLGLMLPSWGK